jgi:pimeloyl-ACP methyl ester carboxylesterase
MQQTFEMPGPEVIEVAGAQFPLVRAGDGNPVLFLHGAWADHRTWSGLWRHIAARHRFLAYTARHFGVANWPPEPPYAARVHGEDLVAILDRLGVPVHLVGWSHAGGMLLTAARDRPALVRSVAVYEPSISSVLAADPEAQPILDTYWKGLEPIYQLARAGDGAGAMRSGIDYVFGLPPGGFDTLAPVFREMFLQNIHTMLPDLQAPAAPPVTTEDLRAVRCPVALVVGQETLPVFARMADAILKGLPNGRRVVLPDIGHGAPVQTPDAFAAEVLTFLQDVEAAGA